MFFWLFLNVKTVPQHYRNLLNHKTNQDYIAKLLS